MNDLQSFGTNFAVPFFNALWDFLGTPFMWGLSLKAFIIGGFVIRLSINLITMIFGIGSGGVSYMKEYDRRQKQKARDIDA